MKHAFRESNRCADDLAKVVCKLNIDIHRYTVAYSFIEKLLVNNIIWVSGWGFTPIGMCQCSSLSLWVFGPIHYKKKFIKHSCIMIFHGKSFKKIKFYNSVINYNICAINIMSIFFTVFADCNRLHYYV